MTAIATTASEVLSLAQQEEDRLEIAVREHSRLVYRIAYSVLRDPAEAEDATQETFLRALRQGKGLDRIEDVRAWLARIAWRVAVERRRHSTHASARSEFLGNDLPSTHPGADRLLLERELNDWLERAIAALPVQLRDALVLSTLEEISPHDVAALLQISEAAVRARTFRARQILKVKLMAMRGSNV